MKQYTEFALQSLSVLLRYLAFRIRHKYVRHEPTSWFLYILLLSCTPRSISRTQHHSHSTHRRGVGKLANEELFIPATQGQQENEKHKAQSSFSIFIFRKCQARLPAIEPQIPGLGIEDVRRQS